MQAIVKALWVAAVSLAVGVSVAVPAEGPDVGQLAPDFELEDSQGKSYRLSELKGKNVVLEFIRSGSW
jgi:cytochrome oxidase Cu insertion factor (SCO1/SenC/PrrC family)